MAQCRVTRSTSRWLRSSLLLIAPMSALVVASMCFTGCGDDKKPNEPTPQTKHYPPPISPDSVLAAFEQAYVAKDIEEYSTLFDHGLFTFAFAQLDLDQNPDLAPTWGWGEEFETAQVIFSSRIVYHTRCDLSARDAPVPATEGDQLGLSPQHLADTKRVRIRQAQVDVEIQDEGRLLTLHVDGDAQEFFIKAYPGELIDGQPRHRIVYWKDKAVATGGGGGRPEGAVGLRWHGTSVTRTTTWGSIKRSF